MIRRYVETDYLNSDEINTIDSFDFKVIDLIFGENRPMIWRWDARVRKEVFFFFPHSNRRKTTACFFSVLSMQPLTSMGRRRKEFFFSLSLSFFVFCKINIQQRVRRCLLISRWNSPVELVKTSTANYSTMKSLNMKTIFSPNVV